MARRAVCAHNQDYGSAAAFPNYTINAPGGKVATITKLAGHMNPMTTFGVYSHAIKSDDAAAEALETA